MRLDFFVPVLCVAVTLAGCTRKHYREKADQAAYGVLSEQADPGKPWAVPMEFTIDPAEESRLYDPSDPDDPVLPAPGPFLYDYALPKGIGQTNQMWEEASKGVVREEVASSLGALTVQPIPRAYWEAVPAQCLSRMLEFESVRQERFDQYNDSPPVNLKDAAPRLGLPDILKLSQLNSREYQARKESLYSAALSVTSSRFQYAPKFSGGGNSVGAAFTHDRNDGVNVNSAGIGSSIQMDKMLSTGGTLLGRLANDVVFTFDGPEGFATDVSSELFLSLNQSVFQRDILLNPLIQAERNLVYAARDYARFRSEFFTQLASRYYGLLQTYRSIEIEAQNYFSLIRTFEQAKAEVRASVKRAPNPVTVDQFEQGMLSGRSGLISTCNRLERGLDDLKLTMGIPTETPVNIDLEELRNLTLLDEVEVAAERVRRWGQRVRDQIDRVRPDRGAILNADIFLMDRLLEWLDLREPIEALPAEYPEFVVQLAKLRIEQARLVKEALRANLLAGGDDSGAIPVVLGFERTTDLLAAQLNLVRHQLDLQLKTGQPDASGEKTREFKELEAGLIRAREGITAVLLDTQQQGLRELLKEAQELDKRAEALVAALDQSLGLAGKVEESAALAQSIEVTEGLIRQVDAMLSSSITGLTPQQIQMDDAMATALVQRLDLMNERGRLADDWRSVKMAADDLKSVLNFDVSQSIRTSDNRPLNFSTDTSRTRVGLNFDLPLNRLNQRNAFRQALINYQAGRRSLDALEDGIKLSVRTGLRSLAEARLQYPISVTRAALAAEQVTSIRLQLALGIAGVRGTDLLDALRSSREALIAVANQRIGYIVDDAEFVLELELMRLDATGYWPGLNDADFQPLADLTYPEGAGPTYGDIPSFLKVSSQIKRMLEAPLPGGLAPLEETVAPAVDGAPAP